MNQKTVLNDICQEKVFEKVFHTYVKDLKRYLYYKYKDLESAEDILQDTFIKLWNNCHKVVFEKVKSYLYTIANNAFLDVKKHEKVVREHQKKIPKNPSNSESPEFVFIEKEYLIKVESAINALPEKQKIVFTLSRYENKKYREIAEMLDISIKTVEKRMQQAILSVKEKIGRKI